MRLHLLLGIFVFTIVGCISVGRDAASARHLVSLPTRQVVAHPDARTSPDLKIVQVFQLPAGTTPAGIALGADGNMWFTQSGHLTIGRITPQGQVTYFPCSMRDPGVNITPGPDRRLWYTVFGFPEIDKMTTNGTYKSFVVQGNPQDIVAGPDGNMWYTDFTLQAIGVITPRGKFKEYTVPTPSSYPYDITSGPDGNLWFTEINAGKIGKITTSGVVTEYTIPDSNPIPVGITSANGNVYAVENAYPKLLEITPSGTMTAYQSGSYHFIDIVNDQKGNLIITARYEGKIGKFDIVTHTFKQFIDIPKKSPTERNAGPDGIALDRRGDIWFTSTNDDYIGVIHNG